MRALVDIRAQRGPGGGTILTHLASQPPVTARATIDGVTLVASAGGPVGGDVVEVRIRVGPGATVAVGSAAAMVVQPGRGGGQAVLDVELSVGAGGRVVWAPEPTVVADGAHLASRMRVRLAAGAQLVLREVVVLGRHGEVGGIAETSLDVEQAPDLSHQPSPAQPPSPDQPPSPGQRGRPLLRQENLWNHPALPSGGPAVLAGHRVVGSLLRVGVPAAVPGSPGTGSGAGTRTGADHRPGATVGAVLRLSPDAVLATALGAEVVEVLRALGRPRP